MKILDVRVEMCRDFERLPPRLRNNNAVQAAAARLREDATLESRVHREGARAPASAGLLRRLDQLRANIAHAKDTT